MKKIIEERKKRRKGKEKNYRRIKNYDGKEKKNWR